MPRKARDERLDTRTARLRLKPRREPYWRSIQEGRAIGYRRLAGGKAGTWIGRHYDPIEGRTYKALGSADDAMDADARDILTFDQAQAEARIWFQSHALAGGAVATPLTVRDAATQYLADYAARGGKAPVDTKLAIDAHVLPNLGNLLIRDLTSAKITAWHRALALAPIRRRTARDATKRNASTVAAGDTDGRRARRATANRVLTVLKAVLNLAYRESLVPSDDPWRRVAPFKKVDAPRVRYLTDDEATRLVNACPTDLRALVTAALLSGCRYGELVALRPMDVDLSAGMLTIPAATSKSGTARHVVLTDEAQRFFGQAMAGKARHAVILTRADGEPWGRSHQFRPLRVACEAARINPAVSFHILRHTHASRLAMKGVPMAVIAAQLGHSDVKLTQRHYAHLSPGYVADTIRAAFGDLGIAPENPVLVPLRGA